MQTQFTAFPLDRKTLRAANDESAKNEDAERRGSFTLRVWVLEHEVELKNLCAFLSDPANASRDRARF